MSKGLEALEDIILYLNATEPKGLYCENIEVIKQDLERLEKLEKENQELAETLELYNEKFAGHERVKADLIKENQELKRKYESHDFLYQNEVSKNGVLAGKIFEKDLKIQKLKEVIKFLGEQLGLDVDLENHDLITDDGTIGFVNDGGETMEELQLLKEMLCDD